MNQSFEPGSLGSPGSPGSPCPDRNIHSIHSFIQSQVSVEYPLLAWQ